MEIPVPVQPSWLRRASAPLPGLSAPGRLFDQRFGEGLLEAELAALCPAALAPYYLRAPSVALPTAQVPGLGEGGTSATCRARAPGIPRRAAPRGFQRSRSLESRRPDNDGGGRSLPGRGGSPLRGAGMAESLIGWGRPSGGW